MAYLHHEPATSCSFCTLRLRVPAHLYHYLLFLYIIYFLISNGVFVSGVGFWKNIFYLFVEKVGSLLFFNNY